MSAAGFPAARLTILTRPGAQLAGGFAHRDFAPDTFYAETAAFSHTLLSHFAQDMHLNSLIKSPNKMVTALVRGLLPLASATPAYRRLARAYQLEDLLYAGPADLARLLRTMDAARDRQRHDLAAIGRELQRLHSPEATARRFLEIIG